MVAYLRSSLVQAGILVSRSATGGLENGMGPKDVSRTPYAWPLLYTADSPLFPVSDTVIQFQGLTVVQVSQNQAAVVSDPQVRVIALLLVRHLSIYRKYRTRSS